MCLLSPEADVIIEPQSRAIIANLTVPPGNSRGRISKGGSRWLTRHWLAPKIAADF